MKPILWNIKKVEYINALDLKGVTVIPGVGAFVPASNRFTALPLSGLADCRVTTKTLDRVKYFTVSLSATLTSPFLQKNRPMAFILTTVEGGRFLLGTDQQPFPQVDTADSYPGKPTERSGCSLSVERSDTFGLLKILG